MPKKRSKVTAEKKLEILYDHYKDTFLYIRKYISIRDKLFLFSVLMGIIFLFQIYSPDKSESLISTAFASQLSLPEEVDPSFIGSILWFLFMGFTVKYFQAALNVDRQYPYLHSIEEELERYYKNQAKIPIFTREGKHYLTNYPFLLNLSSAFYVYITPILFIALSSIKIYQEYSAKFCEKWKFDASFWLLIFNSFNCIVIIISSIAFIKYIFGSRKSS
jgi:hypothetical protein